jgi:LysM repeat protein
MSRKLPLLTALLAAGLTAPAVASSPVHSRDSIGTEYRDGKRFVLYRVESGQTLYSILRKYRLSMADFKAANPGANEAVQFDEVLRIPYGLTGVSTETNAVVSAPNPESPLPGTPEVRPSTHTVQPGETLYSLARRFGLSVSDLIVWNHLPETGTVQTGQVLRLSADAVIKPDSARQAAVSVSAEPVRKPEPKPESPKPTVPKVAETRPEPLPEVRRTVDGPVPNAGTGAKRHVETGLAELIEVSGRSGKYLALHRTAPVGTVLTVKNEANDQTILVKVIGKLPDTGAADRVIVRLSPRAFAQLAPSDKRFRAEVSYFAE